MDTFPPPPYGSYEETPISETISFTIGTTVIHAPLVGIGHLTGHLDLLNAFTRLRKEVEDLPASDFPAIIQSEKEKRWAFFVGVSVERFDKWCHSLQDNDSQRSQAMLPPLDVIMVWHAYLLNPRCFEEDATRLPQVRRLQALVPIFGQILEQTHVNDLLFAAPTEDRKDLWETRTGTPFDYCVALRVIKERKICCPRCRTTFSVPLFSESGAGYLQKLFRAHCPGAGCDIGSITLDQLYVRKFAETIASTGASLRSHFAGTVFSVDKAGDLLQSGDKLKREVLDISHHRYKHDANEYPPFVSDTPEYHVDEKLCQAILMEIRFRSPVLLSRFNGITVTGASIFPCIMSAYFNDKIYSVDLVGAVIRQGTFVQKMYDLGWSTSRDEFQENPSVLQSAIIRYHGFLDLLATFPKALLVPTLDIDLAWHTHQLLGEKYKADCFAYVGRFIDHNDKIEGTKLSHSFDSTAHLWKQHFNVDYSHCGCPTASHGLDKVISKLFRSHNDRRKSPVKELIPTDRVDAFAATHPSDHDAVHFWNHRDTESLELAQDEYKHLQKGFESGASHQPDLSPKVRPPRHDFAFLVKLPQHAGYPPDGLVSDAKLIDGGGGCASGNGNCGGGCSNVQIGISNYSIAMSTIISQPFTVIGEGAEGILSGTEPRSW